MSTITVSVIFLFLLGGSSARNRCETSDGRISEVGGTECVLLTPYYSVFQWATCLTDAYIRRVSNGRHQCLDRTAASCWYQCQLELNSMESGPVYDNCRCSNTALPTTPAVQMPTLPPECFSPGGLDCNWYRECLEVRYPCTGTGDGYAIEYALKYCNLFTDNYNDFSPAGRQWVDGVRKCLQLELVPSLRPFVDITCAELRSNAFNSHSRCYVTPASGAPSICDIPCLDTWKAFWIVNGGLDGAIFSAPVETGKQLIDTIQGCNYNTDCTRVGLKTLRVVVSQLPGVMLLSQTALSVSQYIARYLNLDDNGIGWFPYVNDNDSPSNERQRRTANTPESSVNDSSIALLLVDLRLLNISNGTSAPKENSRHQTLEETITAFGEAVGNGLLSRIPVTLNGTEVIYEVSSVGECGDTLCSNSTNVIVLATAPPPNGAKRSSPLLKFTLLLCVFLVICLK